jgi:hypothetical protein
MWEYVDFYKHMFFAVLIFGDPLFRVTDTGCAKWHNMLHMDWGLLLYAGLFGHDHDPNFTLV